MATTFEVVFITLAFVATTVRIGSRFLKKDTFLPSKFGFGANRVIDALDSQDCPIRRAGLQLPIMPPAQTSFLEAVIDEKMFVYHKPLSSNSR